MLNARPVPTASMSSDAAQDEGRPGEGISLYLVATRLGTVAIILGVALRLMQYAGNRSLWLDEAFLSASIVDREFAALFSPLAYGQTAPLGFLILVHTAVAIAGSSELVLRLVPLIAGVVGLALFVQLSNRILGNHHAVVAVALFSLSPYLIYYSSELKQYSVDVLCAIVLLGLAERSFRDRADDATKWPLPVAGCIVVWLSQPSIFLLAAISVCAGIYAMASGDWLRLRQFSLVSMAWFGSFGASYLVSNRSLTDRGYMDAYWSAGFMPVPPRVASDWYWLPNALLKMFREPAGVLSDNPVHGWPMAIAGPVAAIVGWKVLRQRSPHFAALALSVIGFVLLASALRLYPFGGPFSTGGRVLLFLLPIVFLLIGAGIDRILTWSKPAGAVMLAFTVLPFVAYGALAIPHYRGEMRPLIEYVDTNWRAGDRLLVHYEAQPQFDYYIRALPHLRESAIYAACSHFQPERYVDQIAALSGTPRLWVLFASHPGAQLISDDRELIISALERVGRRIDDQVAIGASVYLYDLSVGNPTALVGLPVPVRPYSAMYDCRGPWLRTAE